MTISTTAKPLQNASLRSSLPPKEESSKDGYRMRDGKPMAEPVQHCDTMIDAITALQACFCDQPEVYISGNDFLRFVEEDRTACLSPDCYIVFGAAPKPPRLNSKIWEEEPRPAVVFERASTETRHVDAGKKYQIYRDILKVPEYYRFDPTGSCLKPKL